MRKIIGRRESKLLLELVDMGKAKVVKEHTPYGPEYRVFSASGAPYGVVAKQWDYIFEAALIRQGNGDGLLEGCDQTAGRVS